MQDEIMSLEGWEFYLIDKLTSSDNFYKVPTWEEYLDVLDSQWEEQFELDCDKNVYFYENKTHILKIICHVV